MRDLDDIYDRYLDVHESEYIYKDYERTDDKLILKLFKLNSEKAVRRFLISHLDKLDIPFERDKMGNVFYVKHKNKPLLSAHMDFIKFAGNPRVKIYENYLIGESMGADDKAGILIILKILEKHSVNFIFSVKEEIGAQGIRFFLRNNILTVPYALVLDREGAHDILCTKNGYATKKLEDALVNVGTKYGFRPARGRFSDANFINKQVSCANISTGSYNPHRNNDFIALEELENTYEFVSECIYTIKDVFPPPKEKPIKDFKYYKTLLFDNYEIEGQ